jgi:hydrogenase maturation protease
MSRIVVIGVGNQNRRDDGVGPAVVRMLRRRALPGVVLEESDGEPTRLLDLWGNASLAVVVDAVRGESPRPGRVHRRSLRHPSVRGIGKVSSHGMDLGDAVALGEALDRLPAMLLLYAVEAADTSFGEGLSPKVAAAADELADEIATELLHRGVPPNAGRNQVG